MPESFTSASGKHQCSFINLELGKRVDVSCSRVGTGLKRCHFLPRRVPMFASGYYRWLLCNVFVCLMYRLTKLDKHVGFPSHLPSAFIELTSFNCVFLYRVRLNPCFLFYWTSHKCHTQHTQWCNNLLSNGRSCQRVGLLTSSSRPCDDGKNSGLLPFSWSSAVTWRETSETEERPQDWTPGQTARPTFQEINLGNCMGAGIFEQDVSNCTDTM